MSTSPRTTMRPRSRAIAAASWIASLLREAAVMMTRSASAAGGQFEHLLLRRGTREKRLTATEFLEGLNTRRGNVQPDALSARRLDDLGGQLTHDAQAEHGHRLAAGDFRLTDAMQCDGAERGEGGRLRSDAVRDFRAEHSGNADAFRMAGEPGARAGDNVARCEGRGRPIQRR